MELLFRRARPEDVGAIVRLLADDHLGAAREDLADPVPASYMEAFAEMDSDARQELIVVESDQLVIGCLQLTIIRGLSNQGARRGQIEAVRVDSKLRGRGIGQRLIHHAVERSRQLGCCVVQLTTHRSRVDAHRFYDRLGFQATHLGYKLSLV
ncbi:MAG: GNAT family N-acetyltransferase [Bryobacteraceae bacterium]